MAAAYQTTLLKHRVKNKVLQPLWPFFRQFPYVGEADIARVDARGAISPWDGFVYNRIPKCGNSTIIEYLAQQSARRRGLGHVDNAKEYFIRPAKVDAKLTQDIKNDFYKFVFVRNPYTRTLSAYLDKVLASPSENFRSKVQKRIGEARPDFETFCLYLKNGGYLDDMHWGLQSNCLLFPFEAYDFVGRFEQLQSDLSLVSEAVFQQPIEDVGRHGPPATNSGAKLKKYYTPKTTELVKEVFRQDFELFDYSKDFTALLD